MFYSTFPTFKTSELLNFQAKQLLHIIFLCGEQIQHIFKKINQNEIVLILLPPEFETLTRKQYSRCQTLHYSSQGLPSAQRSITSTYRLFTYKLQWLEDIKLQISTCISVKRIPVKCELTFLSTMKAKRVKVNLTFRAQLTSPL